MRICEGGHVGHSISHWSKIGVIFNVLGQGGP